jgi:hypothetical protein
LCFLFLIPIRCISKRPGRVAPRLLGEMLSFTISHPA